MKRRGIFIKNTNGDKIDTKELYLTKAWMCQAPSSKSSDNVSSANKPQTIVVAPEADAGEMGDREPTFGEMMKKNARDVWDAAVEDVAGDPAYNGIQSKILEFR